ncbi:MAG: dTDP-4-dehydrorhamnose reductase [Fibromonadaceae bacterium]|jgi:dTDP-4-dehydrorhamnose reductase|nr:dTDP-4-dehydrorhamnose reductase [Fibromonadaceae bacterium]
MKVWITGSKGMLGQDLRALAGHDFEVFESDREVDITDELAVSAYLSKNKPNLIINCAAYTAVDQAETETELNYKLNALGPKVLGECSAKANIGIVHISTDYVLSGNPPDPLTEEAPLNPINAYGKAKAEGEVLLAKANPNHWIIRTAWLYGINGKNFVKAMLNLMRTKEQISVVKDQLGNPTWTCDLATAILKIAKNPKNPGIYHFSNEGIASWHDFAKEIQKQALEKKLLEKMIPVLPIASSEWKSLAKRPLWSAMDKTKIMKNFEVQVPVWQNSLSKYLGLEK